MYDDSPFAPSSQTKPRSENVISLWKSKRMYIVIFLFTITIINYADRVNMSVAAQNVAQHFGWDNAMMGIVMSSFLWTYALCLVPMGWLVDKFGPKNLNTWGLGLWSAAAMCTGLVGGLTSMLCVRMVLGAGESTTWPSCGKVIRNWFPVGERGTVTGIFQAGSNCGAAIAMPIVAWLVVTTGWKMSFIITGATGFIWLFFWLRMYKEPEECPWLPEDEKAYILANRSATVPVAAEGSSAGGKSKVLRLLGQKSVWGLAITQGCNVYTQYLILTWLPSYLMQVKHMDIKSASWFSAGAFLFATVFTIFVGKASDAKLTPESLAQGHRKTAVIIFLLLSTAIAFVSVAENSILIFVLVGLAIAFTTTAISLNIALTNDIIKDSSVTGTTMGILVLGGNVFGLTAPMITGFIAKATGSFDSGFYLAGLLLCMGALASFILVRKPIQ